MNSSTHCLRSLVSCSSFLSSSDWSVATLESGVVEVRGGGGGGGSGGGEFEGLSKREASRAS